MFLGATRARYADSIASTGGFVALRVGAGRGLAVTRLDASYSHFADAGWALQLGGQSTALWRVVGDLALGVAAGAALNDFQDGNATGTAAGGPLVVLPVGRSFVVAGATAGAVRRLDSTWAALGAASLRWHATPVGAVRLEAGATATVADTLRFADLSVGLSVAGRRGRLAAVLGTRAGDLADGAWGSLEAVWTPHARVALEATAGKYPPDLTGFAQGLYAQAGLRLYGWGGPRPRPSAGRMLAVIAESRDDGTVRVAVRLGRSAAAVAIAGDWNDWDPVPLTRDDGSWSGSLRLQPGIYKYAIVADGEWTLPEGVAGMDDGFGGRVGVLVVQRS